MAYARNPNYYTNCSGGSGITSIGVGSGGNNIYTWTTSNTTFTTACPLGGYMVYDENGFAHWTNKPPKKKLIFELY